MAISLEELIGKLNAYGEKVTFLGDGVPVYQTQLKEGLQTEYHFAPAHKNRQSAAAVGALAMQYLKRRKDGDRNGAPAGLSAPVSGRKGAGRKKCKAFVI